MNFHIKKLTYELCIYKRTVDSRFKRNQKLKPQNIIRFSSKLLNYFLFVFFAKRTSKKCDESIFTARDRGLGGCLISTMFSSRWPNLVRVRPTPPLTILLDLKHKAYYIGITHCLLSLPSNAGLLCLTYPHVFIVENSNNPSNVTNKNLRISLLELQH